MEQKLIVRGMLAGVISGLLMFGLVRIFAAPEIQAAIDFEGGRTDAQSALDGAAAHPHGEEELFSRAVQENLGSALAVVLFGLAMGTLLAVAFCIVRSRAGSVGPRMLALLLAGAGLLAGYLVPFMKYPANPPAVGDDATVGARGGAYLLMVVCSVAVLLGATWLRGRLAPQLGSWNASIAGTAAYVVVIGAVMAVLPSFSEMPLPLRDADGVIVHEGFPADVLADFRMYTVVAQVVLWSAMGLLFGAFVERALSPVRDRSQMGRVNQ